MTEPQVEITLRSLKEQLFQAVKQRAAIDGRIAQLANAIEALANLSEDVTQKEKHLRDLGWLTESMGFQQAVRLALAVSKEPLTPVQIRDHIKAEEWMELSAYNNPLASIHTTLRRLVAASEVEEGTNEAGEKAYRLIDARATNLRLALMNRRVK